MKFMYKKECKKSNKDQENGKLVLELPLIAFGILRSSLQLPNYFMLKASNSHCLENEMLVALLDEFS